MVTRTCCPPHVTSAQVLRDLEVASYHSKLWGTAAHKLYHGHEVQKITRSKAKKALKDAGLSQVGPIDRLRDRVENLVTRNQAAAEALRRALASECVSK